MRPFLDGSAAPVERAGYDGAVGMYVPSMSTGVILSVPSTSRTAASGFSLRSPQLLDSALLFDLGNARVDLLVVLADRDLVLRIFGTAD